MTPLSKIFTVEVVLTAATIGILTAIVIGWYQKKKRFTVPTVWEPVGVVKNLFIYPFKSGKGIELQTALCTEYGVESPQMGKLHQFRDRSFLVYNEKDKTFQTARTVPTLISIKIAAVDEDQVTLTAPNMPILVMKVPNAVENRTDIITQHFGEKIPTIDCGNDAAKWISEYTLGSSTGMRIGYNAGNRRRNLNSTHQKYFKVYPRLTNEATGMYSDFSSYLVVNDASVNDLRDRAPEANITFRNFRPNVLIEGADAFAEDHWDWIKIGDVILYSVKPCTRCVLTTVDPDTGTKSKTNEPLKTLRTYRSLKAIKNISLDGTTPIMGLNMGYHSGERMNVGDVVYVSK